MKPKEKLNKKQRININDLKQDERKTKVEFKKVRMK